MTEDEKAAVVAHAVAHALLQVSLDDIDDLLKDAGVRVSLKDAADVLVSVHAEALRHLTPPEGGN